MLNALRYRQIELVLKDGGMVVLSKRLMPSSVMYEGLGTDVLSTVSTSQFIHPEKPNHDYR